jgi:hypothetical protein
MIQIQKPLSEQKIPLPQLLAKLHSISRPNLQSSAVVGRRRHDSDQRCLRGKRYGLKIGSMPSLSTPKGI